MRFSLSLGKNLDKIKFWELAIWGISAALGLLLCQTRPIQFTLNVRCFNIYAFNLAKQGIVYFSFFGKPN